MPKQYAFDALKPYLPAGSFELIMPLIQEHRVHLVITRERQTKLGDYRQAWMGKNHRITVNGNMHPYAFAITMLHELAHLLAFEQFGHRIAPHGSEWKAVYSRLLKGHIDARIFPADVEQAVLRMMRNPSASSCGEEELQRVMRNYEAPKPGLSTVEELPSGARFILQDGRMFMKEAKLRKRIRCLEIPSNKVYLFHPLYEVRTA